MQPSATAIAGAGVYVAPGGARVVDIVDRDIVESQRVETPLPSTGPEEHVAAECLPLPIVSEHRLNPGPGMPAQRQTA